MRPGCDCALKHGDGQNPAHPVAPQWDPLPMPAQFPADWRVRCTRCNRLFAVCVIPGGGIYGDHDWQLIDD